MAFTIKIKGKVEDQEVCGATEFLIHSGGRAIIVQRNSGPNRTPSTLDVSNAQSISIVSDDSFAMEA